MQVINLLTVLFYHTWFYVRYSYWCQPVCVRGDKHQFCNSQILNHIIIVQGWKLGSILQGRYVHHISARQNARPYLSAYYIKTCCS